MAGVQKTLGEVEGGGMRRSCRNGKRPDQVEALEAMAKSLEFIPCKKGNS